jgi:hypothetical protein
MSQQRDTPIDSVIVQNILDEYNLPDFGKATIREVVSMVNQAEKRSGKRYVRMEMGVPGLPPLHSRGRSRNSSLAKRRGLHLPHARRTSGAQSGSRPFC